MKTVVLDCETNGLTDYDKCWVVVCRDVDTNEVATFRHIHEVENARRLERFLSGYDRVVGHNLCLFDLIVLRHFGVKILCEPIDTLIISRLLNYNQEGGHSLEAWGTRFGEPKDTFSDFSQWSQELEDRCVKDTLLTTRLYNTFRKYLESPKWYKPIVLEHKVATLCNTLSTNGFTFDYNTSIKLLEELSLKVSTLRNTLSKAFPPQSVLIKEINPKATKSGALHAKDFKWLANKDLTPFSDSCPFSLFEWQEFNPNSPAQVVARLNAAGWKPTEKTKGHLEAERRNDAEALKKLKETGWKVSEGNLSTLPSEAPLEAWERECHIQIELSEKSISKIITPEIRKRSELTQEGITKPIKNITDQSSFKEITELAQRKLTEWQLPKDSVALFVEKSSHLWSITVTQQEVFVDCSAVFATDTWVSLKNTLSLQERISLLKAARSLTEYLLLSSRLSDLEEWINLYNPKTGRIHGNFNGIGSWTHRKSHQRPNMANIPSLTNRSGKPQPYGAEFRSLWRASPGRVLVGCDAEGIQLRLFAHYCNDTKLIEAIINGKKEEGTDIHSLNKRILDTTCNSRELCRSREVAKTYIYALLLGAGKAKQAQILDCTKQEAQRGFDHLIGYYPGWEELRKGRLREDGERGYFEGLDGRLVIVPSAHHVLAGYLQNGESVVMKMASLLWNEELTKRGIPYKFVNDVHDEWQTETTPQHAEFVGQLQAWSIKKIGEELGLNCPLAGKYAIGKNWKETH